MIRFQSRPIFLDLIIITLTTFAADRANGQTPATPCWTDLTTLDVNLAASDPSIEKTYTLCPNTIFDIGFSTAFGQCCESGQRSLTATSNTLFRCGVDGLPSNNCVLRGGTVQFQSNSFIGSDAVNVRVQGITFESATNAGIRLANAGDVTFSDCIIRGHQNQAPVVVSYTANDATKRQVVEFNSCLFQDNVQGSSDFGGEQLGLITVISSASDVTITNSVFRENVFADTTVNSGYAIGNFLPGGTLTIRDSCFIDNNFIGAGPVLSLQGNSISTSGNYGTFDNGVQCQFVVKTQNVVAGDRTCIPYQESECLSKGVASLLASDAPSTSPTAGPTVGSTVAIETNESSTPPQTTAPPSSPTPPATLNPTLAPTASPVTGPTQAAGVAGLESSSAGSPRNEHYWTALATTAIAFIYVCY